MACGYIEKCRFNSVQYELCHYMETSCQLYSALQENARLKKQIAEGGLEERVKKDIEILGQIG